MILRKYLKFISIIKIEHFLVKIQFEQFDNNNKRNYKSIKFPPCIIRTYLKKCKQERQDE